MSRRLALALRRLRRGLAWVLAGALVTLAVGYIVFEVAVRMDSYPVEIAAAPDSQRLRDRSGQLLREVVNEHGERQSWVELQAISPHLIAATVAVEDARFWDHGGVDWIAVGRAGLDALWSGQVRSGASTLTMQLVRVVEPHERSLAGKVHEMVTARRMERAWDKHSILEAYLNRAPYGAGIAGVEAASQRYFGKGNHHLSLAEAALIAGLPKAPSRLDPRRDLPAALERQRWVLSRMEASGRATTEQIAVAMAQPIVVTAAPSARPAAMHFTETVRRKRRVGGDVVTTLDAGLQARVEEIVYDHSVALRSLGGRDAAVVVLDNEQCDIISMVGSPDYWDPHAGAVNGAVARRQPGSTLKPFVYAAAFEAGAHPALAVADVPTYYGEARGRTFVPRNYDGRYLGPVSMGEALARSLNVPAIRVTEDLGIHAVLNRLHALGFDSLDRPAEHYGLGIVLGNGEVTLTELTQAYATLARGGMSCRARMASGEEVVEPRRVFSEESAALTTAVLRNEQWRRAAFGPRNALMLGFPVAAKTGTSAGWRDGWVIGYTPKHTVGVWVGNFSGAPMNQVAGSAGAGPLFARVMKTVTGDRPAGEGDLAHLLTAAPVCAVSGLPVGPSCPASATGLVGRTATLGGATDHHRTCDWHSHLRLDRRNGLLAGPGCSAEHVERRATQTLPAEYAHWEAMQGRPAPMTQYSPACPADGSVALAKRNVQLRGIRGGEIFLLQPDPRALGRQSLELRAEVQPAAASVTFVIDGEPVGNRAWPYRLLWPLTEGEHLVQIRVDGALTEPVDFTVRAAGAEPVADGG